MSSWRVFIGCWEDGDPEWTHVNDLHEQWGAARAFMDERLVRWQTDSCEDCRDTAAEEHAYLMTLVDGQEFAGAVEGEDYLIIRADRVTGVDDLWATRIRPPVGARRWHGPWARWYTVVETGSAPFDEVAVLGDDGQRAIVKVRSLQEQP